MAEDEAVKLTRNFVKPGHTNEQTVTEVFNGEFDSGGHVFCPSDRLHCSEYADTYVSGEVFYHYSNGTSLIVWDVEGGILEEFSQKNFSEHGIKWDYEYETGATKEAADKAKANKEVKK